MSARTAPAVVAAGERHPGIELLARYRAVFAAAWAARHELAGPRRMADESAFLPAALSLQETPVHPAPRRLALALCGLFALALLWSLLGRIDIVAVAPGRVVVSERTKTVQPLEAGVVTRILVKDGDRVKAGQVLVELDATAARADGASVAEQLEATRAEAARAQALLAGLRGGRAPVPATSDRAASDLQRAQTAAEWQDLTARLTRLGAEQVRREAEAATVGEAIAKLEAMLPLARQREDDVAGLAAQGFMSSHAGQDRRRERIELERDLALQQARLVEAQAALQEAISSRAAFLAEAERQLRERQVQAGVKLEQLVQEARKADQRHRLTSLTAPVSGTVQQLAVHTPGGVVTPAQVLMVVVPQDADVTAEVVIDNQDIGFVNPGQRAVIKLQTFPFTRYGTLEATVSKVAADAVLDEQRGAIFPATLRLHQTHLDVEGKAIRLSPGMNLSAEIKTGERRVIDYLIAPIHQKVSESLGER